MTPSAPMRSLLLAAIFGAVSLMACNGQSPASPSATTGPAPSAAVPAPAVILGRPTDRSVAASVSAAVAEEVYVEWAEAGAAYADRTPSAQLAAQVPATITLDRLRVNTAYSYRVRYRTAGESTFRTGLDRTFRTARTPGTSFTFAVQADPHLDDNSSTAVYGQTLQNILSDRPDFLIDLGDTSMSEKCVMAGPTLCAPPMPVSETTVAARTRLARTWFESVAHSVPLFLVLGNHDGEAGWTGSLNTPSLDLWAVTARKALFPNPEPDAFYSGSADAVPGIGLRQNYYAFEWGDALFVVLDPYTYTQRKPGADLWGWTLGSTQYQWLARTLSASRARYKFVFTHHLLGGNGSETRGGAAFAPYYEWGGRNADGSWAFDRQRPGWPAPIHQLMVDARVTAWFHGHDHLYAREERDGIVYQEVPQPSLARYDTPDPAAGYGYVGSVGTNIFPSSGHLRVSVSPTSVRVEYVRSVAPADETSTRRNGAIVHEYTIP